MFNLRFMQPRNSFELQTLAKRKLLNLTTGYFEINNENDFYTAGLLM